MCAASVILRRFRAGGGTCPQLLGPGLRGDAGRGGLWSRGEDSTTWTKSSRWPELCPHGCPAAGPSEGHCPQPMERTSLLPRSSTRLPPEMSRCCLPQEALPAAALRPPVSCTPHYSRAVGPDPARRGWAAPVPAGRVAAGGPRCRIRSPTGREGRGPLGRGGRPWVVLGRPRVASAGTTCSEGRGRLGGAAWEVEARAPSKPRGQPGLRTPATRPGPQDLDRGPAWPSLPDPS